MKILTLQEFNIIWNKHRFDNWDKLGKGKAYFKKDWSLTYNKTVKDAVREVYLTDNGIPQMRITPRVTKKAIDTNQITNMYVCFAKIMYGFELQRFSSEGRYRPGKKGKKGRWLKGLNNGHADIEGTVDGMTVCIEVKQEGEDQLDSQIERMNYINRNGGFYRIARSFEEYQEIMIELEQIILKRKLERNC